MLMSVIRFTGYADQLIVAFCVIELVDNIEICVDNLIQIAVAFAGDSDNNCEEPQGFGFNSL